MVAEPHWTAYVTALMTPLVAAFGIWIAYQQWHTARDKLRLDLFDRRYVLYAATMAIIYSASNNGRVLQDSIKDFQEKAVLAKWLFDADIDDYLQGKIGLQLIRLSQINRDHQEREISSVERKTLNASRVELMRWFTKQQDEFDKKMHPFLQLSNAKPTR